MLVNHFVLTKGFLDYHWLSSIRHYRHPYFFWTVSKLQPPQRKQRNPWLLQKLLICSQNHRNPMRLVQSLLKVRLALPSLVRVVRNELRGHLSDWQTWKLYYRVRLHESFKIPLRPILSTIPWTNSQRSPWHCRPWSKRTLETGTDIRDFSIRRSMLFQCHRVLPCMKFRLDQAVSANSYHANSCSIWRAYLPSPCSKSQWRVKRSQLQEVNSLRRPIPSYCCH